jgi:hypothetical protein
MTPLELLAAKVRGADSNADGAAIIERWYNDRTEHAIKHAKNSAEIVRDSAALADGLREQLAKNYDGVAELLSIDNQKKEL